MKTFDRILQRWRLARARPWIPGRARVLDVGCADGTLFNDLASLELTGVGLDPRLPSPIHRPGLQLRPGRWPADFGGEAPFDVVTMLAVLEHIPEDDQSEVAASCYRALKPGGRVVLTVPSPRVDAIEHVLLRLRLIDGMALEEHYGFDVRKVRPCFERAGFRLLAHRRFQLGLNNLFVFEKPGLAANA